MPKTSDIEFIKMNRTWWKIVKAETAVSDLSAYLSRFTPKFFTSRFTSNSFDWRVISLGKKPVGSIWFDFEKTHKAILGIYLFKEYRGQSFGKLAIIKFIGEICGSMNIKEITLNVRKKNIQAITLYKKLGFSKVSQGKKDNGIEFISMKRVINNAN